MHRLLRLLDKLTDRRPIQRVDKNKPERRAHKHHGEDEQKHHARRDVWSNDRRKHAQIEKRAFWVQEIVDHSLNEPSSIGPPAFEIVRVESPATRAKAQDPEIDQIRRRRILER